MRSEILLGTREYSDKFESKRFNDHVAHIREECKNEPSGNTFEALIQNYHDEDYFSTDMDERLDKLVAFGYAGTTAMCSRMLSGTGSGLSEGSGEPPAPGMGPTDEPMDTGSHATASEASCSEGCSETRSMLEVEAIERMVFDHRSETQSEKKRMTGRRGHWHVLT